MDSIVAAIGELFGPVWGLILALAAGFGGAAMWLQGGALKAPGPDRDRLLRSLEVGGDLRQLYVFWLTRGLNWVDRLLGDAGKAAFSLPSPFGNREPAPYWTGWSFDVCALLAVVYPLLGVFAAWVWTGDAGAVGRGLGFRAGATSLAWRALVASGIIVTLLVLLRAKRRKRGRFITLPIAFIVAITGIGAISAADVDHAIVAVVGVGAMIVMAEVASVAATGATPGAGILAIYIAILGVTLGAIALTGLIAVVSAAVALAISGAALLAFRAAENDKLVRSWPVFWPTAIASCYLILWCVPVTGSEHPLLLLIVMLGLVPLVNIPFDWASIGVTRALLRRGCERDAPSPFLLGLVDFGFGLLLLGLLAVALLTALLAADHVTAHAGAAPLIDLPRLFHRLATTPGSTANWWIYLTLFSTMLPSVLNCLIGAVSLISWSLPSLRLWMLAVIPTSGLDFTRKLVLLALGGQVFFGTLLTCGALWGLWRLGQAVAPFALSDLLIGAEAWVRALSATGHM